MRVIANILDPVTKHSNLTAEKLRERMLYHASSSPDCPHCKEDGIDWANVEIVERPMKGDIPTWSVEF